MSAQSENVGRALIVLLIPALVFTVGGLALSGVEGGRCGLATSALLALGFWSASDRIALASVGAIPLDRGDEPELQQVVAELSALLPMSRPRLYLIPTSVPNAFSVGRDPDHAAIAVTRGLLVHLPRDELRAVLAHELAHIVHRDTLPAGIASSMAAMLLVPPRLAGFGVSPRPPHAPQRHGSLPGRALAMVLGPLAALLMRVTLHRSRELAADAFAARLMGSGRPLARALLRLERAAYRSATPIALTSAPLFAVDPLGRPVGLGALFRTHPATRERVRRLEMMGISSAFAELPMTLALWTGDVEP